MCSFCLQPCLFSSNWSIILSSHFLSLSSLGTLVVHALLITVFTKCNYPIKFKEYEIWSTCNKAVTFNPIAFVRTTKIKMSLLIILLHFSLTADEIFLRRVLSWANGTNINYSESHQRSELLRSIYDVWNIENNSCESLKKAPPFEKYLYWRCYSDNNLIY